VDTDTDRILCFTAFGVGAGEVMSCVEIAMMGGLPHTTLRGTSVAVSRLASKSIAWRLFCAGAKREDGTRLTPSSEQPGKRPSAISEARLLNGRHHAGSPKNVMLIG
jgi:hypothetical protein